MLNRSSSLACICVALGAATVTRADLVTRSPFLPPTEAPIVAPSGDDPALADLELAGLVAFRGRAHASLYDRQEGFGFWAAAGETVGGITIESVDLAAASVAVRTAIGRRVLFLRGEGETNGSVEIAGRRPGQRRTAAEVHADYQDVMAAITVVAFASHRRRDADD